MSRKKTIRYALFSKYFPLVLLPGFALCGVLAQHFQGKFEEMHVTYSAAEIEAAKESIALSLMGQIQLTAQSLVWMKTLEYLHNGVAYRMPTNAEEERGFRAQNAVGMAAGLDHQDGVPLALNEELDWRGPVGEFHRAIVPHMAKHRHSDPVELIPWYELALRFNPNIERLYSMGAFFMADFAQQPERALRLLEAGIAANPWSFEVRGALGRLLFEKYEQLALSEEEAYERAAAVLKEAIPLEKKEKERLEKNKKHFDDYEKQIFRENYLFLARALTELGRFDEALAVCDEGHEVTGYNHLKVQRRITGRRMSGEEDEETSQPSSVSEKKTVSPNAPEEKGDGE